MPTLIPLLLVSVVLTTSQADGALSRRQPGEAKHGLPATEESRNRSYRTDVSSIPQLPPPPWCLMPFPGAGTTEVVKVPTHPWPPQKAAGLPLAAAVEPGAFHCSSWGAFSSLVSRAPCDV